MSYSFNVRAKSKDEAKTLVAEQLDNVVKSQPIHANDREVAEKAFGDVLELVTVPEGRDVVVSVSGSVGWNGVMIEGKPVEDLELNSANLNIAIHLA